MNIVGKLLITLGVGFLLYAITMSVSLPGSDFVNMALLSDRQNIIILGAVILLSGIILFATNKVTISNRANIKQNYNSDYCINISNTNNVSHLINIIKNLIPQKGTHSYEICIGIMKGILIGIITYIIIVDYIYELYDIQDAILKVILMLLIITAAGYSIKNKPKVKLIIGYIVMIMLIRGCSNGVQTQIAELILTPEQKKNFDFRKKQNKELEAANEDRLKDLQNLNKKLDEDLKKRGASK